MDENKKRGCFWCKHRVGLGCALHYHGAVWSLKELQRLQYEKILGDFYIGGNCESFKRNIVWSVS